MLMALAGDLMLGRLVNEVLKGRPPAFPWGNTLEILSGAEWSFCNVECAITDRVPDRLPAKAFHFRSDRKNVACLQAAGIDAVSVANNHALDFGEEGLIDMLAALDSSGIAHAGAGADLGAAMRPAPTSTGAGVRVGLLACTDNEPGWAAGQRSPGVWFVPTDPADPRARRLLDQVSRLREIADLAVVSCHWGSNWGSEPEPGHRELAHALVVAGAHVVVGHSCHVLRGVEVHRGALILYGAGDLIDDYAVDESERNDRSAVFLAEADPGPPPRLERLRIVPTVIDAFQARLAGGEDAEAILARMELLSGMLGTRVEAADGCGNVLIGEATAGSGQG